jgi:hypothetical protein
MSKNQINTPEKRALIISYCERFKETPSRTLARKLYAENKELFPRMESALDAIRHRRGNHGKASTVKPLFKRDNQSNGFIWKMPESKSEEWTAFEINTRNNLILSDVHIPYHNPIALNAAVNYGTSRQVDTVILNGDISDFYSISRFLSDPKKRNLKKEVDDTNQFLGWLRGKFPKSRIIYKQGNHDERWSHFIWTKAAELWDFEQLQLNQILGFEEFGIEEVKDQKIIRLCNLSVMHGHEFTKGLTNSVNPARGNFLKGLECSLAGHNHRTSEHAETSLSGRFITCWSTGCLCELNPAYARINKNNHGFAFVELDKHGQFSVDNMRILNGKIL